MKHYIIILVAFIAGILMFNSCTSIKNEELQELTQTKVKILNVKKLHINENFFCYQEDCVNLKDSVSTLQETFCDYMDDAKHNLEMAKLYTGFDNYTANKYLKISKENYEKAKTLKQTVDALIEKLESFNDTYKEGDVFVIKFNAKNKFGKWAKNLYLPVTYNEKNKLYSCEGNDFMALMVAAYPKDKDKIAEQFMRLDF